MIEAFNEKHCMRRCKSISAQPLHISSFSSAPNSNFQSTHLPKGLFWMEHMCDSRKMEVFFGNLRGIGLTKMNADAVMCRLVSLLKLLSVLRASLGITVLANRTLPWNLSTVATMKPKIGTTLSDLPPSLTTIATGTVQKYWIRNSNGLRHFSQMEHTIKTIKGVR